MTLIEVFFIRRSAKTEFFDLLTLDVLSKSSQTRLGNHALHTVAAPTVWAAVKTELLYRKDTIIDKNK